MEAEAKESEEGSDYGVEPDRDLHGVGVGKRPSGVRQHEQADGHEDDEGDPMAHQDLHAKQIVVFCSDHGGDTWDRDAKESAAGFHGRHHAHGGEQRDRHAYRARSRLLRFSIAITRILRQVYLFNTLKYNVSGTDCHI